MFAALITGVEPFEGEPVPQDIEDLFLICEEVAEDASVYYEERGK